MSYITNNTSKRKLMIVDDSSMIQMHNLRLIKQLPQIGEIFLASNGLEAIEKMQSEKIDVVILDIQMPIKDGIETLPDLLRLNPKAKIIISSTVSLGGATVTLKALELGAYDYVTKPSPTIAGYTLLNYERELKQKVTNAISLFEAKSYDQAHRPTPKVHPHGGKIISPAAIVIGSSTGGPTALTKIFENIPTTIKIPIIIAQHMPPIFTAMLAENIQKTSGIKTIEVQEPQRISNNCIYVAPGGSHLEIINQHSEILLRLNNAPPKNFCKPSVDYLLSSAAKAYGKNLLSIILTGMGHDGLDGAKDVVDRGGQVIAQDEATSTVWGMPRAVYEAGLTTKLLSLNDIKSLLHKLVV